MTYFWAGDKIKLRSIDKNDWLEWLEDFEDSDAIRLLESTIELPKSVEIAKAIYSEWADFKDTSKRIMFAIETYEGELVGGINLNSMDYKNGTFSFGIRVNRHHRNKGYGSDALRILLRYGFYELRFQKCNSSCLNINEGSIRLHESLGFINEGRRRRVAYTNGQYYDNLLFGLTREEFEHNEEQHLTN